MSRSKDTDLLLAFIRYVLRALAERDFATLRRLRMRSDQIAALHQVRLADLEQVTHTVDACLRIELDEAAFDRTIQRLAATHQRERLKQALVDADANLPMLRQLFGMGNREYTGRRYLSAAGAIRGRPCAPAETEERRVWDAWLACLAHRTSPRLTARDYLTLHETSAHVPLRTIWALTQRWSHDAQCLHLVQRRQRADARS